jgi:hypothetical protein
MVEPRLGGPPALQQQAEALNGDLLKLLASEAYGRHLPLDFYPAFEKDDDPSSGFAVGVPPPRFSHGYWPLRNRLAVLVETHSWRPYRHRVKTTRDVIAALLSLAKERAATWQQVERAVDVDVARADGPVVLAWDNTEDKRTIDFLGYAYTRTPSPVSGGLRTRYDEQKPQLWKVPLLPAVKPAMSAVPPKAGYLVAPGWVDVMVERLTAHGVRFVRVLEPRSVEASVYRTSDVKFGDKPYEGRMRFTPKGEWRAEQVSIPRGSLFVPTTQPLGRLVTALFEPSGTDSFLQWGFFNAAFEQKEYMEAYVAEEVAERMLADPATKKAFVERLERDATFAASPAARLDFFYRRHPSFDVELNRYPVVRVDQWP